MWVTVGSEFGLSICAYIAVLCPVLSLKSWVRNIYLLVTWWHQFVVCVQKININNFGKKNCRGMMVPLLRWLISVAF